MSNERQRNLAALLFLANLFIGMVSAGIIILDGWRPEITTPELILLIALLAISWVNLLIAAGFIGWALNLLRSVVAESVGGDSTSEGLLERNRMAFYYTGVWSNLLVLALLTEVTGGLAESPFVALFIAFVLTGQQVSRFRTQSGMLFISAAIVTALMIALAPLASAPAEPAPHVLTIVVIVLALIAGGLHNYYEKPHNYLVEKHVRPPSRARIYLDGRNNWRLTLLEHVHRQDPVLFSGGAATEPTDGSFPEGLQKAFDDYFIAMAAVAGWSDPKSTWPTQYASSFIVTLQVNPAEQA